ncbi:MAG: hypothetical protein RLZZ385_214 [Pseudomonadota bacterium]
MRTRVGLTFVLSLGVVQIGEAVAAEATQFNFSGEIQARYEALDGQFRRGLEGSDQLLAVRTVVQASVQHNAFGLQFELQDSRTYLDDGGTPLSTSYVNAFEPLQLYGSVDLASGSTPWLERSLLKLGRFTLDIGSRRFVERNDFRNTINGYTGMHWINRFGNGGQLDSFFVAPVGKLPADRASLDDNRIEVDEDDKTRRFWGVHYQHPVFYQGIRGDLLVYGLREKDENGRATLDRDVIAPGLRLIRPQSRGQWDFDLEAAWRSGEQSISVLPGAPKTDVRARMLHAEAGFTWNSAWGHRLSVEYDLATGDDVRTDTFERYERFYGTRRGDLGNTSIHGPLTRSNAAVPGIRYLFNNGTTDGRVILQYARLDSATDQWIIARLQDPTGRAGKTLGRTLDFRVRHWLIPDTLQWEIGGSALWYGRFPREVPGGPDGSRTLYVYTQVNIEF